MFGVDVGLLTLRLILGIVFLAHGVKHAQSREKTTKWFASIGFRNAPFQWFMSTATEIGVGVLMVAGLLTGFAAAGVVGIMFVAFWSVHRSAGFFITAFMKEGIDVEGWEYVFVLAAVAAALALAGPGTIALDSVFGLDVLFDGWIGAALIGLGVGAGAGLLAVFWRPAESG
ncbi:MAG: DoxX family protein [Acidimicrobiia bacterium]|nr:DoxX family protein [Acidimicrobiia bacterium]